MRASLPLSLARFLPSSTTLALSTLQCSICQCIVDRPMEAPCRKLVCAECISKFVRTADLANMPCPCCEQLHNIESASFSPASDVIIQILQALLLHCDEPYCSAVVELKNLKEHVTAGCTIHQVSPSKLTIGQVISRPLQSPPTITEQRAAANVVRRLMCSSPAPGPSCVVQLTTEGKVYKYFEYIHTVMIWWK